MGIICSVKPVLTGLVYSVKGRIFNSMLYVRYIQLTKGQTNPPSLQRGCYIRTVSIQLEKISDRESQGDWRQDEMIGGKPPVVKQLWLWHWRIDCWRGGAVRRGFGHGSRGIAIVWSRHQEKSGENTAGWKRLGVCCSDLQSAEINDSVIVICSYDL
jgi:hypothetical protein